MKAIRFHKFGEPDVLKLEDIPEPTLTAQQLFLRVKASGVNPVDTYIRKGIYGPRPFPFIPGTDAAGVIERVGSAVTRFKPGDRVYVYSASAYAEGMAVDETRAHPLPADVSFAQGAAIGVPYATAFFALFNRGGGQPGETVLVHGASGGVGVAAVQLARARGLAVIGTAGTDAGRKLVQAQGAHHVLDHHDADFAQKLMALTKERGVDLIVEMLTNVNLGKDLKFLGHGGRVVTVGSRGKVEIEPRDMFFKQIDIRGMSLMTVPEPTLAGIHAALVTGLENKTVRPVIGQELPLAEAAKAHRVIMEAGAHGKIVLVP